MKNNIVFVSIEKPEHLAFNYNNFRYVIPTTIITDKDNLDRLEKYLKSRHFKYYINTRWRQKKKPRCIKYKGNQKIEVIYKNKKLQERIIIE